MAEERFLLAQPLLPFLPQQRRRKRSLESVVVPGSRTHLIPGPGTPLHSLGAHSWLLLGTPHLCWASGTAVQPLVLCSPWSWWSASMTSQGCLGSGCPESVVFHALWESSLCLPSPTVLPLLPGRCLQSPGLGSSRFQAWSAGQGCLAGGLAAQLVIPGSPPDGCLLSAIYLCLSCISLQSPARPSVSVQQMPGLTGPGSTGGNDSVSPDAVGVAAFALEVACGAELGAQHTLGVGQGSGQGREHLLGAGLCLCHPSHRSHRLCA